MEQLKSGRIYKIVNDINNLIYIGSTYNDLSKRFWEHKNNSKQEKYQKIYIAMNEIGIEHFQIILVEEIIVKNKDELRIVEDNYICKFDTKINGYNGIRAYLTAEEKAAYQRQQNQNTYYKYHD